jgi:hypothetical protein
LIPEQQPDHTANQSARKAVSVFPGQRGGAALGQPAQMKNQKTVKKPAQFVRLRGREL